MSISTLSAPAKRFLDLNDDVLFAICVTADIVDVKAKREWNLKHVRHLTLLSLTLTCKRLRVIGTPLVFRKTTVTCASSGGSLGYSIRKMFSRWLAFMANAELFARHVKALNITLLWISETDAAMLAKIVSGFRGLQKLQIITPSPALSRTNETNLMDALGIYELPDLSTLTLSAGLEELILKFGTATALKLQISQHRPRLDFKTLQHFAVAGFLSNTRHLELGGVTGWSPKFLEILSEKAPGLQYLGAIRCANPGFSYEELLQSPSALPNLTSLSVVSIIELYAGMRNFHPWPCDLCRRRRSPLCEHQVREALDYAAIIAFTQFRALKFLWVAGHGKVICERTKDGTVTEIHLTSDMKRSNPFEG